MERSQTLVTTYIINVYEITKIETLLTMLTSASLTSKEKLICVDLSKWINTQQPCYNLCTKYMTHPLF